MYLLYLDESGSPDARHFVLAGVSVYETVVHWATEALDQLQAEYFPDISENVRFPATVLRGNPAHKIEKPFDRLQPEFRRELLSRLYGVAQSIRGTFFAVAMEKSALPEGECPYERALEEMLPKFDRFINRRYRRQGQRNKGMVIIADSQHRKRIEESVRNLVNNGTRYGSLYNILDTPAFTLSRHNRLLQIADLVANTVYGHYEHGHHTQFNRLLPKFDQAKNGAVHGVVHLPVDRAQCCQPCCRPRQPLALIP